MSHNYEAAYDTITPIEHVKTTHKWGDFSAVENPWITVLIPTYRRVDLLEEAITSVLTQHHCDFYWDIVVLDNEPDDGGINETEKLIREIDNPRILYYRNSENIRPGDNFNRGMRIARGEWVCFLHDDDYLIASALCKLGELIRRAEKYSKKPLGAISAKYHQFVYDPEKHLVMEDIQKWNQHYSSIPLDFGLYKLTHSNIWFTANIGGDVPTNGTTFRRNAALEYDGFIEDFGISGDLILFYRMENKYQVYSTTQPMGFYRWGCNSMIKPESTRRVIKDGYDFREYVYSKNLLTRMLSSFFRKCHYELFGSEVIRQKNLGVEKEKWIKREDYMLEDIKKPSTLQYLLFLCIRKSYFKYKSFQCAHMRRKMGKIQIKVEY